MVVVEVGARSVICESPTARELGDAVLVALAA
jgi:hypothetical protein